MVNGDELIAKQLSLTETETVTFEDGRSTVLVPVKYVPPLTDDYMQVRLDGTWRFKRWPFDVDESELAEVDLDDSDWPAVDQPGKVFYYDPEENPADIPNWNRVTLEHVDPDDGAVIRRRVRIPEGWDGRRVYLRFQAIYPAGRVYCNGVLLGEHLSGLTPVEWDVTHLVKAGEPALVAVRLLRRHKYVQMDMPRHALDFAGLSQHAFFHATEQCQIGGYHLKSTLDENYKSGRVEGEVQVVNHYEHSRKGALTLELHNPRSGQSFALTADVEVNGGEIQGVPLRLDVPAVDLWNDELPNLYTVRLVLDLEHVEKQVIRFRTGFRRFELKDQRPTLNGNPVKFRGVNHLTFHPEHGMFTPEPWLRRCLTLMKHANVNAIRTHFTGPPWLADLCDELGIYLLQELPIDWGHTYVGDPDCLGPALLRLQGGVLRDRHHPSLMVWSIGNENMPRNLEEHDDFYNHLHIFDDLVKALDPTRPTMFPPPGPANKIRGIFETRVGDIADTHYSFNLAKDFQKTGTLTNPKTWEADMETVTREEALARGWSGVWFSSEYGISNLIPDLLNAPYISVIADNLEDPLSGKNTQQVFIDRLRDEWGYMRDDPTCLGGAYFPWLCAGAGDPWGWVRWGEDADWGVVTSELLPKPAFWGMRVLFSPVRFPERLPWKDGQEELVFKLTNGYNTVDLGWCKLRTQMAGGPPYMGQMRAWRDVPVSCPPGETTTVHVPIWPNSLKALQRGAPVVCRCILLDPQGYRPITHDILVVPEKVEDEESAMPIGPDAVLE